MKKLVLTAAVMGFAASMASAQVYSQNIVGYSKSTIGAGQIDIVSLQFSGDEDGVALGQAFSGLVSDESVLYQYNGAGYNVYDYYGENGWYKGSDLADDVVIGKGEAVWLKGGSQEVKAVQAGEVPSEDSIEVTVDSGIALVASPYPVEISLGELAGSALVSDDTVLYIFNGANYDVYDYYGENGWYKGSDLADDVKISVGQGFWLKSTQGGYLTFNKQF